MIWPENGCVRHRRAGMQARPGGADWRWGDGALRADRNEATWSQGGIPPPSTPNCLLNWLDTHHWSTIRKAGLSVNAIRMVTHQDTVAGLWALADVLLFRRFFFLLFGDLGHHYFFGSGPFSAVFLKHSVPVIVYVSETNPESYKG